jgi:hypothetical protein
MVEYGISDIAAFNQQKRDTVDFVNFIEWRGLLLNLTYLTPKLALMCTPSTTDPIRRNDSRIISDYIHETCGHSFYLVNLHEKCYDFSLFEDQILYFPFPDHCCPRLSFLETVILSMEEVRKRIPSVTFFIHCKAGRGRSGLVAAGYQLFEGSQLTAEEAISYLNHKRSPQGLCISVPSQIRFLHYFALFCHNCSPPSKQIRLLTVILKPSLNQRLNFVFTHGIPFKDEPNAEIGFDGHRLSIENLLVEGEFCISLYIPENLTPILSCQLNSSYFVEGIEKVSDDDQGLKKIRFEKHELDGPHHRRHGKNFPNDFEMILIFENV